ncbi:MAG: histidine kinase [Chitinophagaceae bacterium]
MKRPLLLLLVILVFFTNRSSCQEFSFTANIRDLNLPTREVYKVIQDKKGYLWFATEFGLYRYQQGSTIPIRTDASANHTAVMSVCETSDGTIIFATIYRKIFSVQQDTAIELPFSKNGKLLQNREIIYHLLEIDQHLFIQSSAATYRISTDYSNAEVIEPPLSDAFPVITLKDFLLPVNRHFNNHPEQFENPVKPLEICFPGSKAPNVHIKKWPDAIDQYRFLTTKWRDLHAVTFSRTLVLISPDGRIKKIDLPSPIIALRADKKNGLWVGLYKHGYFYFDDPSLKDPVTGLTGISVSDICVDREGGIWVTSLERGVLFSSGTSLLQHTYDAQDPTPYKSLYVSADGILAAAHGKPTILIGHRGLITPINPKRSNEPEALVAYLETRQSKLFFNHTSLIEQSHLKDSPQKKMMGPEVFTAAMLWNDSTSLAFLPGSSFLYSNGKKILLPRAPELIYHLLKTDNSSFLAASRTSAYFVTDVHNPSMKKIPGDNGRVVQFISTSKGNTFALIQHKGLCIFQHDSLRTVIPSSPGQMYYAGTEGIPGEIWISSNEGVWAYKENDLLTRSGITARSVTDHTVYSFAKRNDRMYLATTMGVISMHINIDEKKETSFPLYLQSWNAGDKVHSIRDTSSSITFDYKTGALSWTFDIASFRPQPAALHYILKGPQADSGLINGQHLQLGNLRPGKYDLMVWATRNDGAVSNSFTQSFRIAPPFWQAAWFITLVLITIISTLAAITWLITRRVRQREQLKRKMENDLLSIRLQALQAQMNPHFVFNAINSIQLFILEHKEQEAYHYLTQFSKLIRRVLTQSRSPLVSLPDELETLRLYVGLEQLRFPDKFDYAIQADPSLNTARIYLPVMLLQPAIENAIVHGIEDNGAQGKISLHITHQSAAGIISFSIKDNGAGKKKNISKLPSKPGHESASSVINAERIAALNKIYNTDKFSLLIQSSSNEIVSGTTVTISIPDNLNPDA